MPVDGQTTVSEGSRTTVAAAERLAVVETKIHGIERDTGVIRSAIHDINNRMTEFVAAERRCGESLSQLLGLTQDLPTIAINARSFADMKGQIEGVIKERERRQGAWRALILVGSALMGAVTIGGSIVGGVLWLLGHGR